MMQSILLSGGGGGLTLIGAISGAGLSSGLAVCLDAGDFQSFIGSGQSVLDRSGNSRTFFLGSGSATDASDPIFNGPSGYLPAYMSFQGTQMLTCTDSGAGAWGNTYQRDLASWSMLAIVYVTGTNGMIAGSGNGIDRWRILLSGQRTVLEVQGSSAFALGPLAADTTMSVGRWHVLGVSVTEGIGSGFFYLNGAYNQVSGVDNFNSTYVAPSVSTTSNVKIGGMTVYPPLPSGSRWSCAAFWDRALTKANFDSLRSLLRGRFGL